MSGCVFCEIVAGRAPASFVHRDAEWVAFLDIQPVAAGHLLVVPVQHAASLDELAEETAARMLAAGRGLGRALRRSGVPCEGVLFLLADGEAAGQEVPHVHLHVIPRRRGDGFGFRFPEGYGEVASRGAIDAVATRIRAAATDARNRDLEGTVRGAARNAGRGLPPPPPPPPA